MTEVDINNNKIIKDLVSDYWGLSKESVELFNSRIDTLVTDSFYEDLLKKHNSEDRRIRFKLDNNNLSKFDKGWQRFNSYFSSFSFFYEIEYENFRSNKVFIDKNLVKLRKALIKYYTRIKPEAGERFVSYSKEDNAFEEAVIEFIDTELERIGVEALPKNRDLELVISLNYADWFLCSTEQDWTSCLNFESGYSYAYWGGIPGLIVDTNRCMIYITDNSKKNYMGIEVDSILSRTWAELSEDEKLYPLTWYPSEFIDYLDAQKITNVKFTTDYNFISKNKLEKMLYYQDGRSCFIYQDVIVLADDMYFKNGGSGHYLKYRGDNYFDEIDALDYDGGLKSLVDNNQSLSNYYYEGEMTYCEFCDSEISEDDSMYFNGSRICYDCYTETTFECTECGSRCENEEYNEFNGNGYCNSCYENYITSCNHCNSDVLFDEAIETNEGYFCSVECIDRSGYKECVECGEYSKDYIKHKGSYYCKDCAETILVECDTCNDYFEEEDITKIINGENICNKCLIEEIDKKQMFFEFKAV